MDPTLILLMIAGFLIPIGAQFWLMNQFRRYSQVASAAGLTGAQVARTILDAQGLQSVKVESVPGSLSDHYDPQAKAVRLSEPIYNYPSLAALAVAAHEVGHAIQDKQGYAWLRVRHSMIPATNIGTTVGPILFLIGFFMGQMGLAWLGIWLFAAVALFQLVTLPVEFNASARALQILRSGNFLAQREMSGAEKVLTAAALTYVAALATTVTTILQYDIMLTGAQRSEE